MSAKAVKDAARVDRRVVRTRRAIMEAFERLLEKKDLGDITISSIAREADIDRKTFYLHFGSIDGLLDAIAEDAVSYISSSVEERWGMRPPPRKMWSLPPTPSLPWSTGR